MRRAVVIYYYFLVQKIEVEKLTLLSTHVSLKCKEVSLAELPNRQSTELTIKNDAYQHVNLKYQTFILLGFKKIYKRRQLFFLVR